MYPLSVQLIAPAVGFAVASDAQEHAALSAAGYVPALEVKADVRADLMAQAETLGLKVDKRWSDTRLAEEVAKL